VAARILVVEDNPTNAELMSYLLRAFGHEVVVKPDGLSGFQAALQDRFDIILSDILMPGIDGYELAQRIKANGQLQSIPLIAVTALAMVGDRERAVTAGFDGYISKPIEPRTFVSEIEKFLPKAKRSL